MAASTRDSQQDDTEKVLFVGDLGYNVTDQILDKAFAQVVPDTNHLEVMRRPPKAR
jgi:RNA recognition motif-containing protein